MGGRMANHLQAIGILGGDDGQRAVGCHRETGIYQLAVHPAGQGRLGQTSTDGRRNLSHGDGGGELASRAVGERDVDHGI